MCEQRGPADLVRDAEQAEAAGFDFAVISDHFNPWLEEQGESPYAWTVLGAVAERTQRMPLMTMVTCPIGRYHPAIVAQKAATVSLLAGGRFTLGLGAGEKLNEHVVGIAWPTALIRHRMLEEAIDIIQRLWTGETVTYDGDYFTVEDAKLYTAPPEGGIPIGVAAGGPDAARLAGSAGAALIATEPKPNLVEAYRVAGGEGPTYGQLALCYGSDESSAAETARRYFRYAVPGWPVQTELPNPAAFAAASEPYSIEDVTKLVPSGPDPQKHLNGIRKYVEAGFDQIALLQAGPDQEGFMRFWERELRPRLAEAAWAA